MAITTRLTDFSLPQYIFIATSASHATTPVGHANRCQGFGLYNRYKVILFIKSHIRILNEFQKIIPICWQLLFNRFNSRRVCLTLTKESIHKQKTLLLKLLIFWYHECHHFYGDGSLITVKDTLSFYALKKIVLLHSLLYIIFT